LAQGYTINSVVYEIINKVKYTILIAGGLCFFIVEYMLPSSYLILFLSSAGLGGTLILSEIFKGYGKFIISQAFTGGVSNFIFIIILLYYSQFYDPKYLDFEAVAYTWIASVYLALFFAIAILIKGSGLSRPLQNNKVKIQFDKVTPIFLSYLIVYSFSQLDLWVLSFIVPVEVIAEYSLAIRLSLLLSFSLMSVRAVAASKIPKLIHQKSELQKELISNCRFTFFIYLLTLLMLLLVGEGGINYLFSGDFKLTYDILLVFSIGQLVNSMTGPCDLLLSHTSHEHVFFKISFISLLVLGALLFILVNNKIDSAIYYAMSVSFSIALQNILISIIVYKKLRLRCFIF